MSEDWFISPEPQSIVKMQIVSKYFASWAQIMKSRTGTGKIAYLDLYSGPGRYKDGTDSTPLLVLQKVIDNRDLHKPFISFFNDSERAYIETLKSNILNFPGINYLEIPPKLYNREVDDTIISDFPSVKKLGPTLLFLDPWGFKGVSLNLINSVLVNWGCDCIVFFNTNAINRFINIESLVEHIDALFGKERADRLRKSIVGLNLQDRIGLILEEFENALKERYAEFILSFCFKKRFDNKQIRVSHYLVFITKHRRGYDLMKEIMAKHSSTFDQGVPSFEFLSEDLNYALRIESPLLDQLYESLIGTFKGQSISVCNLFDKHNVGTKYIYTNYQAVLKKLEDKGKIKVDYVGEKKRKQSSFPKDKMKDIIVTFPEKG